MLQRSYDMKRTKLIGAALILAALFAVKALFPGITDSIITKTKAVFKWGAEYREVFGDAGSDIGLFEGEREEPSQRENQENVSASYSLMTVEHASPSAAELDTEFGTSEGEETVELPAAVAAFIESQEEYSEYELPEKVSYSYHVFKEDYTAPVEGMNSSGFGYRTHPIHGDIRFHYGTDFAAWTGEAIYAFADGEVSFAGYCESYGNYITVEHSDGWKSLYAHCSILYVEEGDKVSAGEKIALVGDTGLVTGPHLHFELSKNGVYINPEYYVN